MKEKSSSGIMKLFVLIVVVGIAVALVAIHIKNVIQKENVKNVQADLLLVQAKIELVKGNYSMDSENNPLKGCQLTQLPEEIDIQEFYDKNIILEGEYEKFYLLKSEDLEQCGLGELVGKYDGYFIVNYEDYEVIYTKGYQNANGLLCYRISELNKTEKIEEQEDNSNSVEVVNNEENSAETNNQATEEAGKETAVETAKETTAEAVSENVTEASVEVATESNEEEQKDNSESKYNKVKVIIKEEIVKAQERSQELSVQVE